MTIRLLNSVVGQDSDGTNFNYGKGAVVEVSEERGLMLVKAKHATLVGSPAKQADTPESRTEKPEKRKK